MKVLSLFSGIGAFEKALDKIGVSYELVNYCEIDKYASKSYAAVHGVSENLNLHDVTKVDTGKLPTNIDLITYGFPCQDISIAGKQKGLLNDDGTHTRSGLFFEALRIIENTKPKIAIAENVKNLTSKKFNAQFQIVLESLEQAGYNNYWQVLNAKDYGVPQNRERVFIVSIRKDIDNGCFVFPEPFELKLRLKDLLESEVDEKFYLSKKFMDYVTTNDAKQREKGNGFRFAPTDGSGIAKAIRTGTNNKMDDNFILEPQVKQIGNCCPTKTRDNPNQGRIYDTEGLSPSLNCMGGGNRQPCILVKGKAEQNIDIINTMADDTKPVLVGGVGKINFGSQYRQGNRIYDSNAVAMCLTAQPLGNAGGYSYLYKTDDLRIRKLTPLECWRLMGFDDEDFYKAEKVNSNTQLYKQAGNSIVVDVLMAIFDELRKANFFN